MKALTDVIEAVNSTLDLETVLTTIVSNSVRLSQTEGGAIYVRDEESAEFRLRATHGMDERLIAAVAGQRAAIGTTAVGEAAARRTPLRVPDLPEEPQSAIGDLVLQAGFRAVLVIPLLRPDGAAGALVIRRCEPGAFSEATLELLETFTAQKVVAIQNARLFAQIEEKGRELALPAQVAIPRQHAS